MNYWKAYVNLFSMTPCFLQKSVDAAKRSVDLALMQYRGGSTDYATVIIAQQALLNEQGRLAITP
ncbi:MAG TPA: hypothetical protein HPP90_14720 [Deltaproteobacteria bacterium]|nr:hypothetical protein [Deltaproteobacteria bacterium]